jgi:hypothetical protein
MLALALVVGAQPVPDPVSWSFVRPPQKPVRRGSTVTLQLAAAIRPGWHLYALDLPDGGPIATEISIAAGQPFGFAKAITSSKAHEIFDPNFNMPIQLYTGRAEFRLAIAVSASAPIGPQILTVETRYQSCNDTICLPPRISKVNLLVQIHAR